MYRWFCLVSLLASPCRAEVLAVDGAHGVRATLETASGRYEVRSRESGWTFAGTLGAGVAESSVHEGRDRLGAFHEIAFRWQRPPVLEASIRTYADTPLVVFKVSSTAADADSAAFSFPRFTELPPADVGVAGGAWVYDMRTRTARRLAATEPFSFRLMPDATAYLVVVPVARSGIALVGDRDKFIPDGRKRIVTLSDEPERLTARVRFASQERSVHLFGYAARAPLVEAKRGAVGGISFDPGSGRFDLEVSPAAEELHEGPGGDPVREALVSLRLE